MTFPSDYKVVRFPGSTTGVLDVYNGFPRQVLIDTQTWTLRLMDGVTPGGFPVVHLRDFAEIFVNPAVVTQGTRLSVEVADDAGTPELIAASAQVRPWSPLVIRSLFEKIANTATAGTWRILDQAMPDALQLAAQPISDLDDAWYDGFYTVDPSSAANLPGSIDTGVTRNLALIVSAQSTDNVMQMLVERDNSAKIWVRVRLDGVWQAWVLATGVTSGDLATKVSKSGDTMSGPLDMGSQAISKILSINGGPVHAANECINGDFDFWERATSQTGSNYGSTDRWLCGNAGSTKVASRQVNVLGDRSHGAKYFMRHVATSVAGAANYVGMTQRVEQVAKWAGKRITVTFEAKADSSKDIAVSLDQNFGTGGAPSAEIQGIGAQRVTLNTTWQKYSLVFDLPSVSGKTLGTNLNDFTAVWFWFDAGSTLNARTQNLGHQSGTFDIQHVSFRIGDARNEADPFIPRLLAQEKVLCERFYERGEWIDVYGGNNGDIIASVYANVNWRTQKRTTPTVTGTSDYGTFSSSQVNIYSAGLGRSTTNAARQNSGTYQADAEL
jgi:hypothetical protein